MIHLDFETRSFGDLKKLGAYAYASHATTQIVCLGYGFDDDPVNAYVPSYTSPFDFNNMRTPPKNFYKCPDELAERIGDGEPVGAHNASFERAHWDLILVPNHGWPVIAPEQWYCSMAAAHYYGLPGSLELAARVADIEHRKSSGRTMMKLTKPRPTWVRKGTGNIWFGTPEEIDQVVEYCKQDVRVERELLQTCPLLSSRERRYWLIDQKINWRGIPIDADLADRAWKLADAKNGDGGKDLDRLTDGTITTPSQAQRFRPYLKERFGIDIPNIQKSTIDKLLKNPELDPTARRILEIRSDGGGVATAKFRAFKDRQVNGCVYGEMIYHGSHTGRWTSKGVQLHNAVKNRMNVDTAEQLIPVLETVPDDELEDVLTTLVRSVVRAQTGRFLIDLDYNAIEARVLAWMANQQELLKIFRKGGDPYVVMAARIYGISEAAVTGKQRALGKVAILGLGYGMGSDRFYETCREWGIDIDEKLAVRVVDLYRLTYPKIVSFWYDFERAVRKAIRVGEVRHWRLGITYNRKKRILRIYLPSGRPLTYHQCRIENGSIIYFGRRKNGSYGDVSSWGGKFTENVDQAIARDLMAHAMATAEGTSGIEVLFTVHDEIIYQVPREDVEAARQKLEQIMTIPPLWAAELPIAVGGWTAERFRKD